MLEAEVHLLSGFEPTDPLAALLEDDYLQVSVQRHF